MLSSAISGGLRSFHDQALVKHGKGTVNLAQSSVQNVLRIASCTELWSIVPQVDYMADKKRAGRSQLAALTESSSMLDTA